MSMQHDEHSLLQDRSATGSKSEALLAWIDTAFTGELVVPRAVIEQLQLTQSAAVMARLADGSEVVLEHISVSSHGSTRIASSK